MSIFSHFFNKDRRRLSRMVRVNHAGELCAKYIYMGQLAIVKDSHIEEMLDQEMKHLDYFEKKAVLTNTRTSLTAPICKTAGFLAGVVSATIGRNYAMALTVGVETVIEEHYIQQLKSLEIDNLDNDMKEAITQFLKDEQEHKELAHDEGGAAVSDRCVKFVKYVTRCAITVAEVI